MKIVNGKSKKSLKKRSQSKSDKLRRIKTALLIMFFSLLIIAIIIGIFMLLRGNNAKMRAENLLEEYENTSTISNEIQADENIDFVEEPKVNIEEAIKGFDVIGKLIIEKIDLELPVILNMTDEALEVSICYYTGAKPGEKCNMVITGHNFASGAHFGNLNKLDEGDLVQLASNDGTLYEYEVYEAVVIKPDDVAALYDNENEYELSLLTCTSHGNRRYLIRCKRV